ncbi:helix-turn-helix domain-containing protein [Streptomyces sp. NBC_01340]|uniref:GlxA family transcriptional regulator n=1 Tax=unclassified Streptomyces TaxID=2593676 RepID=UPI002257DFD9|nr:MULTISPECIES: helix-turn-helix domain-containing protein [unclassified Streptomyces]MCX4455487.1 helix-turn-helix domain-containing protein [Streptomyces sp. NBC_01719]MCX4494847.1 helix-turn-helix domain-containing protein [Streptomyces sp. NBC_01728]WSI39874.1 helix-turn-helix domain-containing protein [Streptomyces sp. NBC_01340]
MAQESSHRVVLVVDENSNPFEMSCAIEVFGLPRPELGRELYDFRLCAAGPRTRMRDGFFTLTGVAGLEAAEEADTLIVPNRPDTEAPRSPRVLDVVRRAHARGARLIGFCSGAFTLAEAGLLDGRRAACHWMWADSFRARFPAVRLEPDVLFVDDGDILTASGSASALDLGLHVVRRDHGAEIANAVSRRLVFAAHRDGGQRQFVERPVPDVPDESLGPLLAWAQERLGEPLTVADLAARAAVSPATLHRRFRTQLGTTPLAWLTGERVALACRLIERGEERLDVVAARSGLGTAANLRARLRRETGLSPSAYRRRFGPGPGEAVTPGPFARKDPGAGVPGSGGRGGIGF